LLSLMFYSNHLLKYLSLFYWSYAHYFCHRIILLVLFRKNIQNSLVGLFQ
jgi:hypothetical protein